MSNMWKAIGTKFKFGRSLSGAKSRRLAEKAKNQKYAFEEGQFLAISQAETPKFAIVQVSEPVTLNMETFRVKKCAPKTKTRLETCTKYEISNEEQEISDQRVLCEVEGKVTKNTIVTINKQQIAKVHKYLNVRKQKEGASESEPQSEKEDEDSEEDFQLPKARKAAAKTSKTTKKQAAKPAKQDNKNYKKGKFNKDVSVTEVLYDRLITDSNKELISECCLLCTNKNTIRAVVSNNPALMDQILKSDRKVSSLVQSQSIHNKNTGFSFACAQGDKATIKKFLDHIQQLKDPAYQTSKKDKLRFTNPSYNLPLNYVQSGSVSKFAFGTHVRAVQMTRGNKQGNNAFLLETCEGNSVEGLLHSQGFVKYMMRKGIKTEILDQLAAADEEFINLVGNNIVYAVRAGHRELAGYCISLFDNRGGFGFNFLHKEALLNEAQDFTEFKKVSVKKVPLENLRVTPIHCACINPNVKYLQDLYNQLDDKQIMDQQWRKLVHYAAACETPDPLNFLIENSHDITAQDERKITPLMIACMTNRPMNVQVLLKKDKQNLTLKTKSGWTAIHYAAYLGNVECLKEIQKVVEEKFVEFNIQGPEKMTPLAVASAYGNLEVAKYLIEEIQVKMHVKDKFKRSPLVLAVMNGNLAIASYLLSKGAEYEEPDSSKNTPLHYAAAYGYLDLIEILVKAGHHLNPQNDWKLTPLCICMLKNHFQCVKKLLDYPDIDVNCKDETGKSMLSLAIQYIDEKTSDYLDYLVTQKKADTNIADEDGYTPLHFLADKKIPNAPYQDNDGNILTEIQKEQWVQKWIQKQLHCCQILLDGGANIQAQTKSGETAFLLAFNQKNHTLVDLFLQRGTQISIAGKQDQNIFHLISQWVFDEKAPRFLQDMLDKGNTQDTKTALEQVDEEGYTPLLLCLKSIVLKSNQEYKKIYSKIFNEERLKLNKQVFGEGAEIQLPLPSQPESEEEIEEEIEIEEQDEDEDEEEEDIDSNPTEEETQRENDLILNQQDQSNKNESLQIDTKKVEEEAKKQFAKQMTLNVKMLDLMVKYGANINCQVQKIKKFRDPKFVESIYKLLDQKKKEKEEEEKELIDQHQSYSGKRFIKTARKQVHQFGFRAIRMQNPFIKEDQLENIDNYEWYKDSQNKQVLKEYDNYGLSSLVHLVALFPYHQLITWVITKKCKFNENDYLLRTPLHLLVENVQYVHFDQSYREVFSEFIKNGANVNQLDTYKESPLAFAIEHQQAEIITYLLNNKADPNILDLKNNFPLKQAVNQKNINLIEELIKQGAEVNMTDNQQRSALHHAFNNADNSANASFNLESKLIVAGADINALDIRKRTPLFYAFVKIGEPFSNQFIDPIECVSSALAIGSIKLNLQDDYGKTLMHYASQHGAFTSTMFLIKKGAEIDPIDNDGNTPLGLAIRYGHPQHASMLIEKGANIQREIIIKKPQMSDSDLQKYGYKEKHQEINYSTFSLVIKQEWQGVAYLILYQGYNYGKAMKDSMNQGKFTLALTLLSKINEDIILQQKDENQQTLFHTLALHCNKANWDQLIQLCDRLKERKVDFQCQDKEGRTPLHYSAGNHCLWMTNWLIERGVDVNVKDNQQETAIAQALKGNKIKSCIKILKSLLKAGASLDVIFTEESIKVTPLIHAIDQGCTLEFIEELVRYGLEVDKTDSLNRTALMHSLMKNNEECVKLLTSLTFNVEQKDKDGKSLIHYVVNPLPYGSFENVELLKLLAKKKCPIDIKDSVGQTPLQYAALQDSKKMYNALIDLGAQKQQARGFKRTQTMIPQAQWPVPEVDFEEDAQKEINSWMEVEEQKVEPDEVGQFSKSYTVVKDGDKAFDILMTKVDIKHGYYGLNLFYRMQLLKDGNRDLFILWTRWGRIGETGAFQRTPFSEQAKAEAEFKKIFKSKSGNDFDDLPEFERKDKKYKLMKLSYKKREALEFLKGLSEKENTELQLSKEIAKVMKMLANSKLYEVTLRQAGVEAGILKSKELEKSVLIEARKHLSNIALLQNELKEAREENKEPKIQIQIREKIMDESSRFYELIPHTAYRAQPVPAIEEPHDLKLKYELMDSLEKIEIAQKILLGAQNQMNEINPWDYMYASINAKLDFIETQSEEYKLIKKYIQNSNQEIQDKNISGIFKLQRKGEAERMQTKNKLKNHFLLWHGTKTSNLIGILTQGLLIAPPEAPVTGWAYGKGIYFADQFSKSQAYSQMFEESDYFLLLCEVALGKSYDTIECLSEMPKGYNSVIAITTKGPDPKQNIVLPNGVTCPVGEIVDLKVKEKFKNKVYDGQAEYIVYDISQVRMRYLVHCKS